MGPRDRFGKLSRISLILSCILLTVLLGILDRITKEEISIYVFYAIPIFVASWYVGVVGGAIVSLASVLVWHTTDMIEAPVNALYPYWNLLVRFFFFLMVSLVVNELKITLNREKKMASRDFLTGVANRRVFFEFGSHEIHRMQRYGRPFTVAFIDLDNFKSVNDSHGHQVGDQLLCKVADVLLMNTRVSDLVARMGGDEFIIIMPETGPDAALPALRKLQAQINSAMEEEDWNVTVSVGANTYLTPPGGVDQLLGNVDRALYEAKRSGKNKVRLHIIGMEAMAQTK